MTAFSFDGLDKKYQKNRTRVLKAIDKTLASGEKLRSPIIQTFEQAVYTGENTTALSVSSGTTALEASLRAVGVQPGDKVIVPAFSFTASAGSILAVGAKPIFIDVEASCPFIDINLLEKITDTSPKAIIAVHLYGTVQSQDKIIEFCREREVALIEDTAQAYGSYSIPEKIAPEDHHVATFSFDPYKVLPGITGGGAVLTKNPSIAEKVRMTRSHGFSVYTRDFAVTGTNAEMSSVDASVLLLEIEDFAEKNNARKEIAHQYAEAVRDQSFITVLTNPNEVPNNYHKFVILTPYRERLADFFAQKGIPTKVHYDRALPDYSLFKEFAIAGYPNARRFAEQALSLPIHAEMTAEQVSYICDALKGWEI